MTRRDTLKRTGGFLVGAGPICHKKRLAESQLPRKEIVRKQGSEDNKTCRQGHVSSEGKPEQLKEQSTDANKICV